MCLDFHAWIHVKNMEEMICKDAKKKDVKEFQHAISNSIELKEVSIVTF